MGSCYRQQSPSDEKTLRFDVTPETSAQLGNLQNPSIQTEVNQSFLLSKKTYNN